MKRKPKRKCKYRYVEFVNKRKLKYDGYDDNMELEIRKLTPSERGNYIESHSLIKTSTEDQNLRICFLYTRVQIYSVPENTYFSFTKSNKKFRP